MSWPRGAQFLSLLNKLVYTSCEWWKQRDRFDVEAPAPPVGSRAVSWKCTVQTLAVLIAQWGKDKDFSFRQTWAQSCCIFLPLKSWAYYVTTLCLSFLLCQMETLALSSSLSFHEDSIIMMTMMSMSLNLDTYCMPYMLLSVHINLHKVPNKIPGMQ